MQIHTIWSVRFAVILSLAAMLSACGGGGGGASFMPAAGAGQPDIIAPVIPPLPTSERCTS
jgi:hypothetical protein